MRLLDGRPKQSQKSGDKSSADTHGECANLIHNQNGEVSERFKEHAWKACVGETQPWVRIPPSPPYLDDPSRRQRMTLRTGCSATGSAPTKWGTRQFGKFPGAKTMERNVRLA